MSNNFFSRWKAFFLLLLKKSNIFVLKQNSGSNLNVFFQYSKFLVEKFFVDYYYDSNQGSYCIMIRTREVITWYEPGGGCYRTNQRGYYDMNQGVIVIRNREVIFVRTREVIMIGTREVIMLRTREVIMTWSREVITTWTREIIMIQTRKAIMIRTCREVVIIRTREIIIVRGYYDMNKGGYHDCRYAHKISCVNLLFCFT
jgi:hypothetical protein